MTGAVRDRQRALKPKLDWLPLARAVLLLYAAADDGNCTTLDELSEMMKEKTGAAEATIDAETGTFQFLFRGKEHGASTYGGAPWALIEEISPTLVDPRQEAEAVFAKEGFVRRSDNNEAGELKSVRETVGLVWRQYLLRDFGRAVAAGKAALVARVGSVRADYEMLTADTWPLLTVVDWELGIARDPDGIFYYAPQAYPTRSGISLIGTETRIASELAAKLRSDPDMKRSDAERWCKSQANVSVRGFLNRVWPKARELAGLGQMAPAGRKRKSPR
jgi:hypothetical protein